MKNYTDSWFLSSILILVLSTIFHGFVVIVQKSSAGTAIFRDGIVLAVLFIVFFAGVSLNAYLWKES
jgi:hypothetical protein